MKIIIRCPHCKMLMDSIVTIRYPESQFNLSNLMIQEEYYCGNCKKPLRKEDLQEYIVIEQEKEVEKMGIKNLTEAEEKEFYRLVEKMNGEEPDKEQNTKGYPKYRSLVYFVNMIGEICTMTWFNSDRDIEMWELGNIFFTEEAAEFAREKRKVEVELQRYADEHDNHNYDHHDKRHIVLNTKKRNITTITCWDGKVAGATSFNSNEIANDAIEAVGKDRILKYIFEVESEGE